MPDFLRKLMDANGVSGDEAAVRDIIHAEIKKHVDDTEIDGMGNLIAHKKGSRPRVMLAAHMDEIGMMVKHIDTEGNIYFTLIGGIEPLSLIGQRVSVEGSKPVKGVITLQKMSNDESVKNLPTTEEMFIDTGMTKSELLEHGVRAGSYINLVQESGHLSKNRLVYGKALDDRIGCYILVELAKRLKKSKAEIFFVFTVQEEIGMYGSKASAYQVKPDWAIAVDAIGANDKGDQKFSAIGKGPCITMKDAGMITNRCINDWLMDIAKGRKIPLQVDVNDRGVTDALSISLSRGGIPATVLSVAVRNIHSTIGIASVDDIENAVKLLEALMQNPPKKCGV
ncbi:MAG: M28 family peptidase [Candidatus Aenigmarchaeota archaeon]|nr:M28 family peptidase [Candidatus Aenigmarchaeota archaeon]